ncbi:MAG: anhydro-N-acetylmuramic acid kinase [Ignavibacteriales bacterium]|nr:anhydro-N-acetylmuramic acid kinase [Ignavibacteriales bacterium]MCF8305886.1 anhydro-N-acetylmuramic acid kinase [Ignavibacteriales bacterium]MCF8315607.1 anhydro-N-acetylmuramic acid kinase [Ignavibacteriales bacterium]MCF8437199.1 anhydro-N-acetylmuramic acid kinase [Ignavibacteriales bacterium]
MKNFIELTQKEKRKVIGLMTGTSLDGVDTALVEITGNGPDTRIEFIGFLEYPFPAGFRDFVIDQSRRATSNVEDLCRLNFLLPDIYADAVRTLCAETGHDLASIDLIGSHGQTVQHLPEKHKFFGYSISSTLQIGDPAVLAKKLGIVTVGDFRTGDVALGGQGAPLVPYFDYIIFRDNSVSRALLNIGGISNFTVLDKNGTQEDVYAFDTGPGGMLIDICAKRFYGKNYDSDGAFGASGNFCLSLFEDLKAQDSFIERKPPKSTGRELYGEEFLTGLFEKYGHIAQADWMHTITKFTAYGIHENYRKFVFDETRIDELIVSGGGARNKFLLRCLSGYFGEGVRIRVIDELGISSDAKEAICFAVLANETISGNASNIPRTTGAAKTTILGKICLP